MSTPDWYRTKLAQMRGQTPAPRPTYQDHYHGSFPVPGGPGSPTQGVPPQRPQQPQDFNPNQALPPGSIGIHDFPNVMKFWRGGKARKLNPEPCPECGSSNFVENYGARRGPQPAPHCWNCGYNGLFEQGLPSTWGAVSS